MAAIGYIRVSTSEQATDGVSLEAQAAKIRAYCDLNDLELAATYADEGLSGKRADNRPQFQAALDHACRTGSALVVYSLSRFARNTAETIALADRLQAAGADLVSLSEKIDTTTAAGKMVFRMLAVLAEFERDQVSERTKAALAHKRSKGERISGRIPFGKTLASDGKALLDNPVEQRAIELMAQLRADGWTLQAICDELQRRQIATKTASTWRPNTVRAILAAAA